MENIYILALNTNIHIFLGDLSIAFSNGNSVSSTTSATTLYGVCALLYVGDGVCDDNNNKVECGYDDGDCCLETCEICNGAVDKTYCSDCICHQISTTSMTSSTLTSATSPTNTTTNTTTNTIMNTTTNTATNTITNTTMSTTTSTTTNTTSISMSTTSTSGTTNTTCLTTSDSDSPEQPCVFPWIDHWYGLSHGGCANPDDDAGGLWCPTKLNNEGVYIGGSGFWGYCSDSCLGVTTTTITTPIITGLTNYYMYYR